MGRRRTKKQSSGLTERPLFEGVLIKNQNKYSLEVRKGDGELQTVVKNAEANPDKLIKKIPFVRGIFVLVQDIILVLEGLEFSAETYGNDVSGETVFDKILHKLFGKHTNMIVSAATALISFVLCLFFVTVLPIALSHFLERYIINRSVIHIIEFAASVFIMVVYLASFLLFKDVRRMMKYHGAEHMCINCIERGRKLNYKNVASSSRFFPRCTTNYIAFCVLLSIILFVFVRIDSVPLRLLFRLLYIPLATGLFYELYVLISFLPDGPLLKILSAPGMFFQLYSTLKPDDEMIATAMASLDAVFDWREFLVINFPDKYSSADFKSKKVNAAEAVNALLNEQALEKEIEEEFARAGEEILQGEYEAPEEDYVQIEEEDEYYFDDPAPEYEEYYEPYDDGNIDTYAPGYATEEYEPYYVNQASEEYGEYYVNQSEEYYEETTGDRYDEEYYVNEEDYSEDENYVNDSLYNEDYVNHESEVEHYEEETKEDIKTKKSEKESRAKAKEAEPEKEKKKSKKDTKSEITEEEKYDNIEDVNDVEGETDEVDDLSKTQPVGIDFMDDYGFDPEEEEVDVNTMSFEPVDESKISKAAEEQEYEDQEYEEGNVPLFSKEIESIPMPESLDNIVEVMPQGGVKARVYINPEEAEKNEFADDFEDEDIDFDNIIDENGHLTLRDTDAFNRMLDEEYDEIFKRLGLDSDDL